MTPELSFPWFQKEENLPSLFSWCELFPLKLENAPGLFLYEPARRISEYFPELGPNCFLIKEWIFDSGYSLYPSSRETLGSLFYSPNGFRLDISYEPGKTVIKKVPVQGHQGFGKLWVLEKKRLTVYRSDQNQQGERVMETESDPVLIPKLTSKAGVILTTNRELKDPGELEILLNILKF